MSWPVVAALPRPGRFVAGVVCAVFCEALAGFATIERTIAYAVLVAAFACALARRVAEAFRAAVCMRVDMENSNGLGTRSAGAAWQVHCIDNRPG